MMVLLFHHDGISIPPWWYINIMVKKHFNDGEDMNESYRFCY